MKCTIRMAAAVLVTAALLACARTGRAPDQPQPIPAEGAQGASATAVPPVPAEAPATGSAAHGAPGAVAGSWEDWCSEHEVPESLCTRCNPDLVAAFQATGDWCGEHGLPESQCKRCNPDIKIERPPRPEGK